MPMSSAYSLRYTIGGGGGGGGCILNCLSMQRLNMQEHWNIDLLITRASSKVPLTLRGP